MRRVLAVVLVLWEPLTLALAASTLLRRIMEHGVPAYGVLVVKVFVAGVGIAAGRIAGPALAASVAWTGGWLIWTLIGVRRPLSSADRPSG